jgi:hypothetical protein
VARAGDLEVRDGAEWGAADVGDRVPSGAEVRTGEREARLTLTTGELWLAPGSAGVLLPDGFDLHQGDVLVRADRQLALAWERVEVTGVGVFRMRLGSAPRVGVYRGQVNVVRPGEQAIVPALRQVIFAGRRLPASQPLGYRSADPWDTVWMTHALQFDAETDRLARGIERSYGAEPQPLAFYAQFAPDADPALNVLARTARERDDDGAFGPPSDALIALFIAQATGRATLDDAVRSVVALRAEGARWGLVGVALEVTTERLAAVVDLGHAQHVAVADTAPAQPPQAGAPGQPPPDAPPSSPPPPPPPASSPDDQPPVEEPDPGQPDPADDDEPLEPVRDPVEELLGDLLNPIDDLLHVD